MTTDEMQSEQIIEEALEDSKTDVEQLLLNGVQEIGELTDMKVKSGIASTQSN